MSSPHKTRPATEWFRVCMHAGPGWRHYTRSVSAPLRVRRETLEQTDVNLRRNRESRRESATIWLLALATPRGWAVFITFFLLALWQAADQFPYGLLVLYANPILPLGLACRYMRWHAERSLPPAARNS